MFRFDMQKKLMLALPVNRSHVALILGQGLLAHRCRHVFSTFALNGAVLAGFYKFILWIWRRGVSLQACWLRIMW